MSIDFKSAILGVALTGAAFSTYAYGRAGVIMAGAFLMLPTLAQLASKIPADKVQSLTSVSLLAPLMLTAGIIIRLYLHRHPRTEKGVQIQNVLRLEERLNAKVLQQPEATQAVARSLINYTAGLSDKEKPVGVFLFIGPTGVGKTELAKMLALDIYGKSESMLRFDMSQFSEPHSVSRLIGPPPGYVNHQEGGQLTNPLQNNSKQIVLLDEIEKAHTQVVKFFLPVFDEGFLLNSKGKRVSCNEALFIMTSNLCSNDIVELYNKGYTSEDVLREIEPQLTKALSPEIYTRAEIVLFNPFKKETMASLVDLSLNKIARRVLKNKKIYIDIDQSLKDFLIDKGYHPLHGARPLSHLIERSVLPPLGYKIIQAGIQSGTVKLRYDNGTHSVQVEEVDVVRKVRAHAAYRVAIALRTLGQRVISLMRPC